MSTSDALLTVAEIAIALAGFSAVVAAFVREGELSRDDRVSFAWLFTTAFVAALLAFVPTLLAEASVEEIWRSSSRVMVLAWLASMGLWVYLRFVEWRSADASPLRFSEGPLMVVPALCNLALQCANGWGDWWAPNGAVYLLGTLVWLYTAALMFMSIVLERPDA